MDQIIIDIHNWNDLDLDKLAEFTYRARQARPETYNENRTIESEKRLIKFQKQFVPAKVITSYANSELIGWLSCDTSSTTILEIGRWLPIVFPCDKEKKIVSLLIEKCKEYSLTLNYPRIEVTFSINDKQDKQAYEIYRNWYTTNDMLKKDEIVYMLRNLSENDISELNLPEIFETKSVKETKDSKLYKCYYEAFIQGKDRMFQNQTDKERKDYFDDYYSRSKPYIEEASLIIRKKGHLDILGFSLVRPREDDAHVALIVIHPKYQRRNLGKMLLKLIIKKSAKRGFKTISLGVDSQNTPALKLYLNNGFQIRSRIITHSWRLNRPDYVLENG
ncbi:MAG: GNAT family N-acetyltransferase [Candidatus Hodarchaeota archaeon]